MQRYVRQDVELLDRPVILAFQLNSDEPVEGAAVRNVSIESAPAGRHIAELAFKQREYETLLADVAARRRNFTEALEMYSKLWPLEEPVRLTQEGNFLVIAEPSRFEGNFRFAGSGWDAPKPLPGGQGYPIVTDEPTIKLLAKPGLKIEFRFYPSTSYQYKWEGQDWMTASPGQSITAPAPAQVQTLTIKPEKRSALQAIVARE